MRRQFDPGPASARSRRPGSRRFSASSSRWCSGLPLGPRSAASRTSGASAIPSSIRMPAVYRETLPRCPVAKQFGGGPAQLRSAASSVPAYRTICESTGADQRRCARACCGRSCSTSCSGEGLPRPAQRLPGRSAISSHASRCCPSRARLSSAGEGPMSSRRPRTGRKLE